MRKKLALSLAVIMMLAAVPAFALATGNGAPSGAHYNLNVIGVDNPKTADMSDTNGHSLFVPLSGKTTISLCEGPFGVLDRNGTDGKATFQLPAPDPENDGITTYSVYVRALGKPGGSSTTTPYLVDENGDTWWSTGSVTVERKDGKSSFTNVSRDLLYIYADMDGNGTDERYPLFGNELWSYFWEYDNHNLKLAQFRFYEIPTDVN